MPNSRHIWVIGSPSRSRATKRRRSSITELAFHGIDTSRPKAESVTHVSGTKCHPCLGPLKILPDGSREDDAAWVDAWSSELGRHCFYQCDTDLGGLGISKLRLGMQRRSIV